MAKSGVSKSQLYHYFADKDALVLEVIALQTDRVLSAQQPHLGALDLLKTLRLWRDAIVQLNKRAHAKGCPLGSLASELANDSEAARKRLAAGFAMWGDLIELGLVKMRERGALARSANRMNWPSLFSVQSRAAFFCRRRHKRAGHWKSRSTWPSTISLDI